MKQFTDATDVKIYLQKYEDRSITRGSSVARIAGIAFTTRPEPNSTRDDNIAQIARNMAGAMLSWSVPLQKYSQKKH